MTSQTSCCLFTVGKYQLAPSFIVSECTRSHFLLNQARMSYASSLVNLCLTTVMRQLSQHEEEMEFLPRDVKDRCLKLMSRRGLVTDKNIAKVIHRKTKVLNLSDSDAISDAGLEAAARLCIGLVKLDLNAPGSRERTSITPTGLLALAPSCPRLQVVLLRRCAAATDDAIACLAKSCPHLRQLNLSGCRRVTDSALTCLAECSRFLQSIDVTRTRVTDCGVVELANGECKQSLMEIHMGHCVELSDAAVIALVKNCPNLSTLIFHGCPLITDQSRLAVEAVGSPMKQLTWTVY
eukprot:m.227592 g.227592  ORF g.227592 m.227592 type:complete len:294 (+) comp40039_c1_seq29:6139-7020(+)